MCDYQGPTDYLLKKYTKKWTVQFIPLNYVGDRDADHYPVENLYVT